MSPSDRIRKDRTKILKKWFHEVLESYPKQSRSMIALESDRFANPMGSTLNDGVEAILSVAIGDKSFEEAELSIERLIKLKAIQEGQNGGQLDFLFSLKKLLRQHLGVDAGKVEDLREFFEIEDRIDHITKTATSIFILSREKILELQVSEIKNKTYMMRRLTGEG